MFLACFVQKLSKKTLGVRIDPSPGKRRVENLKKCLLVQRQSILEEIALPEVKCVPRLIFLTFPKWHRSDSNQHQGLEMNEIS